MLQANSHILENAVRALAALLMSIERSSAGPAAGAFRAVIRRRAQSLRSSHRDPEAFHVEKDEIERALRQLARQGR